MELCYLLFTLLIILLSFIIYRFKKQSTDPKLPPGPWQLPIIGSLHHLLGGLPPHRILRDLSKTYGPLMHMKLGEVSHVIVSSPEAAKEIMKTQDTNFAYRPLMAFSKMESGNACGIVFLPYGEKYKQVRKICTFELFSPKRVNSFMSIREEEVCDLVLSISSSDGSLVNLTEKLALMMGNIVSRAAFGSKCKHQNTYLEALKKLLELSAGFSMADIYPSLAWLVFLIGGYKKKIRGYVREQVRILEEIIGEHREKRRGEVSGSGSNHQEDEDFLDVLLRHQEDADLQFELTTDWIMAIISDIFGAGTETSSTITVWAMTELIRNPRVMKKVQEEVREALKGKAKVVEADIKSLNYMQLVIKEAIRLHIPAPLLIPRECQNTCHVLGYKIPKMTRVLVNAWAIARDPEYWDDAEDFKPERFEESHIDYKGTNFEFLPFGAGRRMCPGALFGMSNVEVVLAQLLYYFNWELPNGVAPDGLDMNETFGISARKRDDLFLHAIPHIAVTDEREYISTNILES